QFFFAIVLLAIGAVANIWIPIQLGRIVDVVIDSTDSSVARISTELVIAALIAASFSAWGFFVLSQLTERVIAKFREYTVDTRLGLPVHRVEDAGTGYLVSRSTDDVAKLSKAMTETMPILANSGFAIVTTALALVTL